MRRSSTCLTLAIATAALAACNGSSDAAQPSDATGEPAVTAVDPADPFETDVLADLDEPWAIAFLPDGSALITEKTGHLVHLAEGDSGWARHEIAGAPAVDYGGQGGLGDIRLDPGFADNGLVWLSYAEAGDADTRGAAVAHGRLTLDAGGGGRLDDLAVVWRQQPKVEGRGHFGHRILFGPDGDLWISSGERQKGDPAQDLANNLGSVIHLNRDGTPAADNPFADRGGVSAQIWSYGHRNPLGFAFAPGGQLWVLEHGPAGGDELNEIARGDNYGWPIVSNGDDYDGTPIPDHDTHPEFHAPVISWSPVIAPGNMIFYTGSMFPSWEGDALISGLKTQAIIRVDMDGAPREAARYDMGSRIRAVAQAPDGSLWVLEDEDDDSAGRVLRLTPRR